MAKRDFLSKETKLILYNTHDKYYILYIVYINKSERYIFRLLLMFKYTTCELSMNYS